ncbi:LysM peptidoglycan-binding domain-containing protein [Luteimonas sp. e5]
MANTPIDPDKLSLSGMGGDKDKGGAFSGVSGGSSGQPAQKDPRFAGVTGGSSAAVGAGGVGARSYTVQSGDSLSKIAQQVYGDGNQWQRIFEANRDQIDDPDRIFPGQTLKLP